MGGAFWATLGGRGGRARSGRGLGARRACVRVAHRVGQRHSVSCSAFLFTFPFLVYAAACASLCCECACDPRDPLASLQILRAGSRGASVRPGASLCGSCPGACRGVPAQVSVVVVEPCDPALVRASVPGDALDTAGGVRDALEPVRGRALALRGWLLPLGGRLGPLRGQPGRRAGAPNALRDLLHRLRGQGASPRPGTPEGTRPRHARSRQPVEKMAGKQGKGEKEGGGSLGSRRSSRGRGGRWLPRPLTFAPPTLTV